ncbi:MAG: serine O-acetyltransferase EpsC [Eubacteriales bacterium]
MKITVGIGKSRRQKPETAQKPERISLLQKLLTLCEQLEYDMNCIRQRDPAARSNLEVALLYSGFHAVTAHKLSHYLHQKGYRLTARALSQFVKMVTGIEIHPGATIGKGLFIDHGSGVVIGETAEIGDNCTLYQGVTLGGTGKDCGKRHPTLGSSVMVGAGAKVLGPFKVGDHAKIAAGAVVLKEIPENSTAVGIPAKVVRLDGEVVEDLDQVHIPDPIAKELAELRDAIAVLSEKVK